MQAATTNRITQTQHTQYKAVDYSAGPDPDFYAPEAGKITAYGDSGTCGNRLELTGPTGRHGFCHLEKSYVSVGQTVKRGQKLGKMGYTGYTIPDGPAGRHLHWVISKGGVYTYPPSLINETFIKEGVNSMASFSQDQIRTLASKGSIPQTEAQLKDGATKPAYDVALNFLLTVRNRLTDEIAQRDKEIAALKAQGSGEYVPVSQLYIKKV